MPQYEKEFKNIVDHAISNNVDQIIFQERNLGSSILISKLGNISVYNDSYEKEHIKNMLKSIYEKYTSEKFDEDSLNFKVGDFNFNDVKLEYRFMKLYPHGFDVFLRFI